MENFFNKGDIIGYNVPGEGTRYIANDIGKAGTILIDPTHVAQMVKYAGSDLQATRDLIIHELGHFAYELQDKAMYPSKDASLEVRLDYCFNRESEASVFFFFVAKEPKEIGIRAEVPGTNANPDLYSLMLSVFNRNGNLDLFAKQAWANDPKYVNYCKANFGKVGSYIPPDGTPPQDGADGDGTDATGPAGASQSGSGGGGGGGGAPTQPPYSPPPVSGGGYWKPYEPHPRNEGNALYPGPTPTDSDVTIDLVGGHSLTPILI